MNYFLCNYNSKAQDTLQINSFNYSTVFLSFLLLRLKKHQTEYRYCTYVTVEMMLCDSRNDAVLIEIEK